MNKIKIQRKKHLFKKNVKIYGFQLLGDGRIAMSLGDLGIAIIDPNLLEIMFTLDIPGFNYISLKKDILAIINKEFRKISIIKIEEKNYHLIQKIVHSCIFSDITKLRDWTFLANTWQTRTDQSIIFYKEKDDLYFVDSSIFSEGHSKFIFQLTDS